ncbi:MAG TPA: rod shape-determining protein RodA [Burkholderiales bacterium]|nr:rod shape-determining protein RodA [Burkholderiales bacterium]
MFIAGMIVLLGLFTLYSAANENMVRVNTQLMNIGIALFAMWIAAQIPPQTLMRLALPAYLIGVALLIAVAMFGDIVNGARRWLHVGVTRFQPSEMMKIAMPLMLAWYFHKHEAVLRTRDFIFATVLLAIPAALIMRQPDLGTALLVLAAGFYIIFLAGLPWRIIGVLAGIVAAATPVMWSFLHDYQQRRILTLINPTSDPLGAGYHIIQSTIAVGSGGLTGKGWLQGTQTHLEFIPERHTDFIFAVYSEEFGLVGNCILLLLYLALIGRGLMIASGAASFFGRLLAGALTLSFFTYAFVNMGMVSGILPVVGVPLPLISYGGTALVTLFLGIGILMSIHKHRKLVQT